MISTLPARRSRRTHLPGLVLISLLGFACDGDGEAKERSSREGSKLISELTSEELDALCDRTDAHWQRFTGKLLECEFDALADATDRGQAPFSASVCLEHRRSCYDELGPAPAERRSECRDLGWFGPRQLPSCDVTVEEFESCSERRAAYYASVSCEKPAAYDYQELESIRECFVSMRERCRQPSILEQL